MDHSKVGIDRLKCSICREVFVVPRRRRETDLCEACRDGIAEYTLALAPMAEVLACHVQIGLYYVNLPPGDERYTGRA